MSDGVLSITALMLGSYTFAPDQVVALEAYQLLPVIGRGIRIVHTRSDYPKNVVFWCVSNPSKMLHDITAAGFQARAPRSDQAPRDGIAVRWSALVAIAVLWNVLFMLDGSVPWNPPKPPGPFVVLALGIVFAGTFALLRSSTVQAWIMRPGRSVTEIAPIVNVVKVVSALLLIGVTLFNVFNLI